MAARQFCVNSVSALFPKDVGVAGGQWAELWPVPPPKPPPFLTSFQNKICGPRGGKNSTRGKFHAAQSFSLPNPLLLTSSSPPPLSLCRPKSDQNRSRERCVHTPQCEGGITQRPRIPVAASSFPPRLFSPSKWGPRTGTIPSSSSSPFCPPFPQSPIIPLDH
jgi:hypothetical protein